MKKALSICIIAALCCSLVACSSESTEAVAPETEPTPTVAVDTPAVTESVDTPDTEEVEISPDEDLTYYLLGKPGDSIYFSDGADITVTLEDALPNLVDMIDNMLYQCELYDMEFSLDYTYSDGSSVTDAYIADTFYVTLLMGWVLNLDVDLPLSESSLDFLTDPNMDTYLYYGYTVDNLTTHTYYNNDLYPYLLTQYGTEEGFAAWLEEYGITEPTADDLESYQFSLLGVDFEAYRTSLDIDACTGLIFDGINYSALYENLMALRGQ